MSLYDDASLALLTGAGAGKDGKLYVAKPAAEFGDELITNGGFDTDTDWTLTGSASISGGVANFGASGDYLITNDTPIPLSVKQYRIEYEVVSGNAGALRFAGGSSAFPTTTIPSTVGTHIVYVTSNGTQSRLQFNSVGFIGSIDNVSVKEVLVNADFEFTRGSNLAATRVNSDGLIEKGRENLLTYSNAFDTLPWSVTGIATPTTGESGYDGTTDAWLIETTASSGRLRRTTSLSGVNTFSFYAKKGNVDYIAFFGISTSGSFPRAWFNLETGDVSNQLYHIDAKIEPVSGVTGWYRCSITFNEPVTELRIYPTNTAGAFSAGAGETSIIQDAQLEQGLVATEYIESGASTGKAGILENEPRFDYSGGATCPSLLLEPTRTQIIPYSEALLSYNQFKVLGSETTIGYTSDTTPEGITSLITTISETATTGNHRAFFEDIDPCTIGSTYSFSVFAKSIGGRNIRIGDGGKGFEVDTIVDLSDGTILTDVDNNVTVNAYGNGWYRISMSGTNNSIYATQRFFINSVDGTTLSFAGDVSKGVLLWGAQFEEGSYPTSYIPNHSGGSVTRSYDDCDLLDLVSKDIITDATEWTIMFEVDGFSTEYNSPDGQLFAGQDSTLDVYMRPNKTSDAYARFYWRKDSKYIGGTLGKKIIARLSNGTGTTFVDGVLDASGSITGDYSGIGFNKSSNPAAAGYVKQILVFPEALTDVECIKLTEL